MSLHDELQTNEHDIDKTRALRDLDEPVLVRSGNLRQLECDNVEMACMLGETKAQVPVLLEARMVEIRSDLNMLHTFAGGGGDRRLPPPSSLPLPTHLDDTDDTPMSSVSTGEAAAAPAGVAMKTAAVATNTNATTTANTTTTTNTTNIAVTAANTTTTTTTTTAVETAHPRPLEPRLLDYWNERGWGYTEDMAASICQVVVEQKFGMSTLRLSYPADKVCGCMFPP